MEGRLIEFIEEGQVILGLCLATKKKKLHVLTVNNKEINISANRVLLSSTMIDISKPRSELLERLLKAEQEREKLKTKVNVEELWELVKDEDELFDTKDLAQLVFGPDITEVHVSATFRALFENKIYFKLKNGVFVPNTEQQVSQIIERQLEEKRKKELIEQGSKWIRDILEGKSPDSPPFADKIIKVLMDFFLFEKEAKDRDFAQQLLARSGISDPFLIKDLLIKIGVWEEDENVELLKKRIPLSFSNKILDEVRRLRKDSLSIQERVDLRDKDIFTIDGEDTKDFDDALSIEKKEDGFRIGVHISDVSEFIKIGSLIDLEARKRTVSCYLPRRQIPMLPEQLSHDLLSLRKDEDRLAISLFVDMDYEGNIKEYKFVPTVIRVKEQLTYNSVDNDLDRNKDLLEFYNLALKLKQKRIRKGALDISLPEVRVLFNDKISIRLIPQDTPAHTIVAEFMILYNWLCAKICFENNIPLLFRTQEKSADILPKEGVNKLYYTLQQIKNLGPMIISTTPAPHNVLGLEIYTQATSPLRRYLDLVVQRQLKAFLFRGKPEYSVKQLEEIRMEVEPVLREIQAISRNRIRYWTLKYLADHTGDVYKAIVLDELKRKYRIVLIDFLLIAEIKKKKGVLIGSEIEVKIKKVDPWRDIVELEYA